LSYRHHIISFVLSSLIFFLFLAKDVSAQFRVVQPSKPLEASSILVIAEQSASQVHLVLDMRSAQHAYQLRYSSSKFRLTKGLNPLSFLKWQKTDTLFRDKGFGLLGMYEQNHEANIWLIQNDDTLFHEAFIYEHNPNLIWQKLNNEDSAILKINPELSIDSLQIQVMKGDSIATQYLFSNKWTSFIDYDSLSLKIGEGVIFDCEKPKAPAQSRVLFERVEEEVKKRPLFKIRSSNSAVNSVFSDTLIQNNPLQTPYATAHNQTKITALGVPIDISLFGFYEHNQPISQLFVGPASYFNVSFDAEEFKKMYTIDPSSVALKDQVNAKRSELSFDRMETQARIDELKGNVPTTNPLDSISSYSINQKSYQDSINGRIQSVQPTGLDTSQITNSMPFDTSQVNDLSWRERRELRKLESDLGKINHDQSELINFQSSLDSLKSAKAGIGVDQLPSALDDKALSKLIKRPSLKNIESLQIGNVYPYRTGSLQSSYFAELIGASVNYKLNKSTSVYALAGQNKLSSFIPMTPLTVYEAGVSTTQKKLKLAAVASAEVGRNMNGFFKRNGRQLEFDSISSVLNQNLYITAEYSLFKGLMIGAEAVIPVSNFTSPFSPLGQREKVYATYTNSFFGLSTYVENHPLARYTEIDFGSMQDVVKYGSQLDLSFFKKAVSLQIGYDYLYSGLSDTTSEGTSTQHGFNFNVNVAFDKWPSLNVIYTPFSSANGFLEPVTGQFVQMTNQTELWSGVMTYQRPMGNFFYVFSANYQNVANSSVYSLNPETPVYSGSFESGRLTVMMRSKKHTFSINGIAIRGTAQDQIGASGIYKFGLNTKFTIGETSGYNFIGNQENFFTAAIAEVKLKSFGFNLQAGAFFSSINSPHPYARFGVTHVLK
jgi:hypothetical protein